MTLLLIFLFGALAISFLCSILEASLMSTPISFITMKEEEGSKLASRFKQYKQDTSKPITAILCLNTIANTVGAVGVGSQAQKLFPSPWIGVVSALTTLLILVFAEIIPKTIGATRWRNLMPFTTRLLDVLIFIMWPFVVVFQRLTELITPRDLQDPTVSRDEVSAIANVAEEDGDLEEEENKIIQNLINMDEMTAADAMTPRVVCDIASESMSIKAFYRDKSFRHHSRIPVYARDDEYITGYILRMEALQLMADDKFDETLASIRRDIASFNEDTPLDTVWEEMLHQDEQIAVIINEYGSFQGIVTLEDIIEMLLDREIVDEQDVVRDMQQLAMEKWKNVKAQSRKSALGKPAAAKRAASE